MTERRETPVRAERLRPALQARVLGRAGVDSERSFRVLHLARGTATLRGENESKPLAGPMVGWFPWDKSKRLDLAAGAQGTHLILGQSALERALRHRPEAAQLRFMANRLVQLRLVEDTGPDRAVSTCMSAILSEAENPTTMSAAVVESLLHVLLVLLFRGQPKGNETGGPQALGDRFATLVEAHFRDHWTAEKYASVLGISRDRLNDICLRTHGRTPGALIRTRLHLESRLYLENAPLSLDQISALLGFSGTSQFNRFFKAQEGMPPGRYRVGLKKAAVAGTPVTTAPYAWP